MTKPVPRIGSRKNGRRIPKGVIHVQASFSNTIVTVTDVRGRVVSWASAGSCPSKFKGKRRGTPYAAQEAASMAILTVVDQGMQRAEVMVKGPGLGRDAALRAIRRSGILLSFVRDVTPMPHNGCRPPKKRRV
uniref:Small ribosomal subunit protein uS11c n=1 Tax=Paris tetraphylla TaxID=49670 RepID=A0A6C0MUV8_PARTT|nr:30S ribosomal protein S11 [Paris tetraphylla]QHV41181.1 30S ribosomal protein S11 [Paris tetraphylla]